jgi:hypothetical protein
MHQVVGGTLHAVRITLVDECPNAVAARASGQRSRKWEHFQVMHLRRSNLNDGPVWGWAAIDCSTIFVGDAIVSELPYDALFPLSDVANAQLSIPSREYFELDCLLAGLGGSLIGSSLVEVLSKDARYFILQSFEQDSPLVLSLQHVVHIPERKAVAFVLYIDKGEGGSGRAEMAALQKHAQSAAASLDLSRKAWQQASHVVKKANHLSQYSLLAEFFISYPEMIHSPSHPVNAIRRSVEDALLHSRSSSSTLPGREPVGPLVREFLPFMPVGIVLESEQAPDVAALAEFAGKWPNVSPPRNGSFHAVRLGVPGEITRWIIAWEPHQGQPPFAVLKAATCGIVPSILALPLREVISPPVTMATDLTAQSSDGIATSVCEIHSPFGLVDDDRFRISDLMPASQDPDEWIKAGEVVSREIRSKGTEALAWHQGFHSHTEAAWGIFFNASQIDGFVQGVCASIARATQGDLPNFGYTAMAVMHWIAEHEWFHARVEAALTQLELTSGVPRCEPYKRNVYRRLFGVSDDCLEEALANYAAQESLVSGGNQWANLLSGKHRVALAEALEAEMNLSPPGYRAWERGRDLHSWRSLSWELMTGRCASLTGGPVPPVEAVLLGPLPYDHQKSDIAWYVYGEGVVTNALVASPSMLSVPARRELAKALRYLGYKCEESRGKGSHEMWFKDDGNGFPLPRRDPVGRRVFSTFLSHSGVETKARYLKEVRPYL